jgi:hypothetical protein
MILEVVIMDCCECDKRMKAGDDIFELDFPEFNDEYEFWGFCSEECALKFVKEAFRNDDCYQLTDDEFRKHIYVFAVVGGD